MAGVNDKLCVGENPSRSGGELKCTSAVLRTVADCLEVFLNGE